MVMSPTGHGPDNDCAGEGQQHDRLILSSERMLHKDYKRKCSVEEKSLVLSLKGLGAKKNWLAVNRQS
jgi:hypothetical protein